MSRFRHLTRLDLANPATSLSENALIELLSTIGGRLTHLNISGHDELGDLVFKAGIGPHAKVLTELRARDLPLLTDEGVAKFFGGCSPEALENEKDEPKTPMVVPPLEIIDLSRAPLLSSRASMIGKTQITRVCCVSERRCPIWRDWIWAGVVRRMIGS
jgi:DNA repair protein RAD7